MPARRFIPFLLLAGLATTSCTESGPAGPDDPDVSTLTVDASEAWTFVAFDGDGVVPVSVSDPAASTAWDIGFYATSVMLNGGSAGPSDVDGYCVCQNSDMSDAQVLELSAESELAAFEAVGIGDVPGDGEAWTVDALRPAIDGWYSYNPATHVVSAAPEEVWYVRTASGDAFAKLHIVSIEDPTQEHAGRVSVEFALQTSAGADFQPTEVVVVDLSAGAVDLDLETASTVAGSEDWDLRLSGYEIRVNGGVSGDGQGGAAATDEAFEEIDDASNAPASVYAGDGFGGVFSEHAWYRYNIEGNHQIWPTYDVFLVRADEAVYKVQITSYYGPSGDTRQITFRYERLDG